MVQHKSLAQLKKMTMQSLHLSLTCLAAFIAVIGCWIVPQPPINVWTTLAKSLQQEGLCLAMDKAEDPMSSCLIGIPLPKNEFPFAGTYHTFPDPVNSWDEWVENKLPSGSVEPQEIQLLGSTQADICVTFDSPRRYSLAFPEGVEHEEDDLHPLPVFELKVNKNYTTSSWCNYTAPEPALSSAHPKILPKGIFFICGNLAWAGIPTRLKGGPCTLGRLVTLTPDKKQLLNWNNSAKLTRPKKEIINLDPNCNDTIVSWPRSKKIAASILVPWVAVYKALSDVEKLECWLGKHAKLTSEALSQLLSDEEAIKHATLQNRAAIDFLLLAHGHGCEDFEGMCCFNFSTHGQSIAAKIRAMQDQVDSLKSETETWWGKLFSSWGLSNWAASIIKSIFWIILYLCLIIIGLAIFKTLFVKYLTSLLFKRKGGDVTVALAHLDSPGLGPDKYLETSPWD